MILTIKIRRQKIRKQSPKDKISTTTEQNGFFGVLSAERLKGLEKHPK